MWCVRGALVTAVVCFAAVSAEIFFEDRFLDGTIANWKKSETDSDKLGTCEFAKPKEVFDEKEDGGIKTTEDAKFYRYSAEFSKAINNKDKDMCIQFSVKHEQEIDCGGGYVKLMNSEFDPAAFTGDSKYEIMFGPDICGYDTRKVHVIFSHKGENHLVKTDIPCKTDTLSHLYTLHVRPNNTYEVLIDREHAKEGSLDIDFDMIPPKKIPDPEAKKPSSWVDEAQIPDPEDEKPEDWDKPKTIVDTNAKKPDDWDDETDGEWEAPMIENPEYKGEWHPKMIPNPEYKGEWAAPLIDNPEYQDDPNLYVREIKHIGLDLWQVKSGTIFDDFIVSDDLSECEAASTHWKARFDAEKEAADKKRKEDEEKMKKDAEEAKAKEAEEKKDEEVDADEEDKKDADEAEEKEDEKPEAGKHEEL